MGKNKSGRVPIDVSQFFGAKDLFRLSVGSRRDAAVDAWLNDGAIALRPLAKKWFVRMRHCGDDVRELIHDGCPVACVQDVPFGYVNSFRAHVNVGFFYGADLRDPAGLLAGSGKRMRHVKLDPGREPDAAALSDLIDAAYLDVKERLSAPFD
jgi:hypothetical protein